MCRWSIGLPRYFGFAAKHLHIFGHHSQAGTLLAGLFVVPGIEAEMTFDEDLAPFLRNSCATSAWRPQSVTSTKTVSSFFEPSSFFMTRFTAIPMSARVPFGVYLGCGSRVRFPGKKTLLKIGHLCSPFLRSAWLSAPIPEDSNSGGHQLLFLAGLPLACDASSIPVRSSPLPAT
jgi:hypothetical protein